MKKLIYVIIGLLIVLTTGQSMAEMQSAAILASQKSWTVDSIGIDYQYGKDNMLPDSMQGDHCTNIVSRYSVRLESNSLLPFLLNDSWDKWTLGTEFHYSAHKANEKPDRSQDSGFKEIGFNITAKRHLFDKMFYVGVFAGLAYVHEFPEFENRNWKHGDMRSNIGRSHVLGSWGALVGKDWHVYRAWSLRTEFRASHTSDPFRSDSGKNFIAGIIGVTYQF